VGNETLYFRARLVGADGIVSGVAAALPELLVAIDRAIQVNDGERAKRLNARLEEFIHWIDKFPAGVAIKQAAVARGWKLNHFPFPLDDNTQAELAAFHDWLRAWLPVLLSECSEAEALRA
jgi:4-hydroxy-tetrahydrodipicolinate synthase